MPTHEELLRQLSYIGGTDRWAEIERQHKGEDGVINYSAVESQVEQEATAAGYQKPQWGPSVLTRPGVYRAFWMLQLLRKYFG